MENIQNIPNVSCVFRQLVQLSNTNSRLRSFQQANNFSSSNNFSPQMSNYYSQKVDLISDMGLDDRQKRHQQLMNRLKNSLEQNKQLFGTSDSSGQRNNSAYSSNFQSSVSPLTNQYSRQTGYSANVFQVNRPSQQPRKWTAPKLKYRHIEDFSQKSTSNPSKQNETVSCLPQELEQQIKLKSQFYESNLKSQNQANKIQPQRKLNQKVNQAIQSRQDIQDEQNLNQQQNFNKFSRLSQKQSKYNENLESYYDICRKPIKSSFMQIKQSSRKNQQNETSQKFIRKQVPKVQGINLQKAMRILSLDD